MSRPFDVFETQLLVPGSTVRLPLSLAHTRASSQSTRNPTHYAGKHADDSCHPDKEWQAGAHECYLPLLDPRGGKWAQQVGVARAARWCEQHSGFWSLPTIDTRVQLAKARASGGAAISRHGDRGRVGHTGTRPPERALWKLRHGGALSALHGA